MEDLFEDTSSEATLRIVDQLESKESSLEFQLWMRSIIARGLFKIVILGLIRAGLIKKHSNYTDTVLEAFECLRGIASKGPFEDISVALCDLKNGGHKYPFRELERNLNGIGENNEPPENIERLMGTISHQAVIRIFAEGLDRDGAKISSKSLSQLTLSNVSAIEPKLISDEEEITLGSINSLSFAGLIKELGAYWQKIAEVLAKKDNWGDKYLQLKPLAKRLKALLYPIFGPDVYRISHLGRYNSYTDYLTILALSSWATAAPEFYSFGKRIFFREIPVLAPNEIFNSRGKADCLEVISVKGVRPIGETRLILEEMTKRRYHSIAFILKKLEKIFGSFSVKIIDLKFAVGDSINPKEFIRAGQLFQALPSHLLQLQQYLTLAAVDRGMMSSNDKPWEERYFEEGEIVYFLSETPPITKSVRMTPSEQEKLFIQRIIRKLKPAQGRAGIRVMDNKVILEIRRELNGKRSRRPARKKTLPENELFPVDRESKSPIVTFIEKHREFADPETKILEKAGIDGREKPWYFLHLEKLLTAIGEGKVNPGSFDPQKKRGHISCLVHNDPGPSFWIDLRDPKQASFKCFGCGIWGKIIGEVDGKILSPCSFGEAKRGFNRTRDLTIPEAHTKMMKIAQKIFQEAFWESEGEKYLKEKRGLDPKKSFELGAGFADESFVIKMLEAGYTLEELNKKGFIYWSSRANPNFGLCHLLQKDLNLKPTDFGRKLPNSPDGEENWEYPYSPLSNRVTFPLGVSELVTSFYGRAIRESPRPHYKLWVGQTKVPSGAFNIDVIAGDYEEILFSESPIESTSLYQMGFPNTVGLCGKLSYLPIEEAVRSGKDIGIALNNDGPGREQTVEIINMFEKAGLIGRIRDFTCWFREQVGLEEGEDYNDFWRRTNSHYNH